MSERLLCMIYASPAVDEMYLYVDRKIGLERVPAALLDRFGSPRHVMTMVLDEDRRLGREDAIKVRENIRLQGFHLQMPPARVNQLDAFRAEQEDRQ